MTTPMTPLIALATALSVVNVALLVALTAVWVRNYREFGSNMVAGLAAFGLVMLVENGAAIVFFFSTTMLYSGGTTAQLAVIFLRGLQTVALAFLTYVTLR